MSLHFEAEFSLILCEKSLIHMGILIIVDFECLKLYIVKVDYAKFWNETSCLILSLKAFVDEILIKL